MDIGQIGVAGYELIFLAGAVLLMTINSFYEEWLEENGDEEEDDQ